MKFCFKLIGALILFMYAANLFSQTVCSGKIVNAEGMALSNVNIMIRDAKNEKIYAFATSTKDGSYSLNYQGEKNNKKIVFRLLGYDEETVGLSVVSFPYNVVLSPTNHVLNEIVVKPQAIREKKDTTEYLVSAFSDGMERSIDEVLKKMPGIDVSDNGTISFKGKEIEKILLDDIDLFDKNYTLASKNVPAKFIDKVQAIENYHDNRLLKDAENSEKVVLNLSVREDLKMSRPVGQLYASGGYENRYSFQPNLLSVNKKLKLFDALNINNSDISSSFSPEDHLNTLFENMDSYAGAEVVNNPFISSNDNIKRAETRQTFNSLNFVYQPANQFQITGNLIFDQTRKDYTDHTQILYFPDSLLIDRTSHIREKPQTIYGILRLKYDIKENMSLNYTGKYNNLIKSGNNELFIPEAGLSSISGSNRFLSNDLEFTIAMRDSSAFIFKAATYFNRSTQHYNYLLLEDADSEIDQKTKVTNFQYNASAKYYNRKSENFFYTLAAIYNRNNQNMDVRKAYQPGTSESTGSLDDASLLMSADITYKFGISSVLFQSGAGYRKQQLNVSDSIRRNDQRFEYSPRLSYLLKIGRHKISLSGNYNQGKFSLLDYLDYFTDYRDQKLRTKIYTYGSTIGYSVSYIYSGPLLQPFFYISYINTLSRNIYATETYIGSEMNYSSLIPGNNKKDQFLYINFRTYIDKLRHGIDLNSSLYYSDYFNAVNSDVLRKNKMLSSTSRFSIRSVYDIPFNYTIGVRFNYSSYQTDLLTGSSYSINYSLFQDFLYKPTRRLKIKTSIDEYFLGRNHSNFYLFIRPDITYSFPKYRLLIGMSTYNILNNTRIASYQLNDYYSMSEYYNIVPAQYMLNVQYQF